MHTATDSVAGHGLNLHLKSKLIMKSTFGFRSLHKVHVMQSRLSKIIALLNILKVIAQESMHQIGLNVQNECICNLKHNQND